MATLLVYDVKIRSWKYYVRDNVVAKQQKVDCVRFLISNHQHILFKKEFINVQAPVLVTRENEKESQMCWAEIRLAQNCHI